MSREHITAEIVHMNAAGGHVDLGDRDHVSSSLQVALTRGQFGSLITEAYRASPEELDRLARFVECIARDAYSQGMSDAQGEIRKALGLT